MTLQEFGTLMCTIKDWEANAQAAGIPDSSLDITLGDKLYLCLLYEPEGPLHYTIVHAIDGDFTPATALDTTSLHDADELLDAIRVAQATYDILPTL